MSFLICLKKFNSSSVHFGQSNSENGIIFTRIVYSTPNVSLNNIGITMCLLSTKSFYSQYLKKWVINYDPGYSSNIETITHLKKIEENIISQFSNNGKHEPVYYLADQLESGSIKVYSKNQDDTIEIREREIPITMIIHIYGVWEKNAQYGISFRLTKI